MSLYKGYDDDEYFLTDDDEYSFKEKIGIFLFFFMFLYINFHEKIGGSIQNLLL